MAAQKPAPRSIDDFAGDARRAKYANYLTDRVDSALAGEIVDAYQRGYGVAVIARWLKAEHNLPGATQSTVRTFLQRQGVELRGQQHR